MKEDADKFDILSVYYTKEELLHSGSVGRTYFKKFEGLERHKYLLEFFLNYLNFIQKIK